jgi:hypothetical protein
MSLLWLATASFDEKGEHRDMKSHLLRSARPQPEKVGEKAVRGEHETSRSLQFSEKLFNSIFRSFIEGHKLSWGFRVVHDLTQFAWANRIVRFANSDTAHIRSVCVVNHRPPSTMEATHLREH